MTFLPIKYVRNNVRKNFREKELMLNGERQRFREREVKEILLLGMRLSDLKYSLKGNSNFIFRLK